MRERERERERERKGEREKEKEKSLICKRDRIFFYIISCSIRGISVVSEFDL